jgi:hypothetical protein
MNRPVPVAPLCVTAIDLLTRADAELVAAQLCTAAGDRFVHAHLAGLRAAAAVLAVRGRPTGRRGAGTAWQMLAAVAPEMQAWAVYFGGGAALRRAVEAGRSDAVDATRAEEVLCAAEDFLDQVRSLLDPPASERSAGRAGPGGPGRLPLLAVRAS